jgi:hypothetical protein
MRSHVWADRGIHKIIIITQQTDSPDITRGARTAVDPGVMRKINEKLL